MPDSYKSFRYLLLLGMPLVMLGLNGCSTISDLLAPFTKQHVSHAPTSRKTYDAENFVSSLSKAELMLANGDSIETLGDNLDIIKQYTAKKNTKPSRLVIAAVEYQSSEGKKKIMIPLPDSKQDVPALQDIMTQFDRTRHNVTDILIRDVVIAPKPPVRTIKDENPASLLQVLQNRQQVILASAGKVNEQEEAKDQLLLLGLFMKAKQKDAAYLCADNAKRLLARPAKNDAERLEKNQMTEQLSSLEGRLRQEMPY
jgi:hypothetical protein